MRQFLLAAIAVVMFGLIRIVTAYRRLGPAGDGTSRLDPHLFDQSLGVLL